MEKIKWIIHDLLQSSITMYSVHVETVEYIPLWKIRILDHEKFILHVQRKISWIKGCLIGALNHIFNLSDFCDFTITIFNIL